MTTSETTPAATPAQDDAAVATPDVSDVADAVTAPTTDASAQAAGADTTIEAPPEAAVEKTFAEYDVHPDIVAALSDAGIVTKSPFRAPLAPFMSYVGLAFLFFVLVGMAYSGYKSDGGFWDKTNLIVVVIGIVAWMGIRL